MKVFILIKHNCQDSDVIDVYLDEKTARDAAALQNSLLFDKKEQYFVNYQVEEKDVIA
jgi:hypothetical protein